MNRFSPLLLCIVIGLLLALPAPSAASQLNSSGLVDPAHTPFAPGVVLVGLKSNTAPAITSSDLQTGRTGLNRLLVGLAYNITEGLWSASGYGSFVAGQPMGRVFLPMVIKGR